MSKPANVSDFTREICEENKFLEQNAIKIGSMQNLKEFRIRLFTCDAPARAFITEVKSLWEN